jgi:hypothetical protein
MATHYEARELLCTRSRGQTVPPANAKPFRQGHKNDFRDARAIAEAVQCSWPNRTTRAPGKFREHHPDTVSRGRRSDEGMTVLMCVPKDTRRRKLLLSVPALFQPTSSYLLPLAARRGRGLSARGDSEAPEGAPRDSKTSFEMRVARRWFGRNRVCLPYLLVRAVKPGSPRQHRPRYPGRGCGRALLRR